jgi:hypothetical protein
MSATSKSCAGWRVTVTGPSNVTGALIMDYGMNRLRKTVCSSSTNGTI